MVKNLPAIAGITGNMGLILRREGPLEEEMATHSSIFVWKTLWTDEPGRLCTQGRKESHATEVT